MRLSVDLNCSSDIAAKRLLGSYLIRTIKGQKIICRIVETEAYDQSDPASHSYKGITERNSVMFGPAGYAYVYFTYGMHHCLNIVVGPKGHGSAVLIRAVEPLSSLETIKANRNAISDIFMLTNGPGKLCQALVIDRSFNGHNLTDKPLQLILQPKLNRQDIISSKRVGISQAKNKLWRFYIKDNPYVSRYS